MTQSLAAPSAVHGLPASLAWLSQARIALANARTAAEAKGIKDGADLIRTLMDIRDESEGARADAADLHLCAMRTLGEQLSTLERASTAGLKKGSRRISVNDGKSPKKSTYSETLDALKLDRSEAVRCQRIATVPEAQFKAFLADGKGKPEKLTQAGALALSKPPKIKLKKKAPSKPAPTVAVTDHAAAYDTAAGVAELDAAAWRAGLAHFRRGLAALAAVFDGVDVDGDKLAAAMGEELDDLVQRDMTRLGHLGSVAAMVAKRPAREAVSV